MTETPTRILEVGSTRGVARQIPDVLRQHRVDVVKIGHVQRCQGGVFYTQFKLRAESDTVLPEMLQRFDDVVLSMPSVVSIGTHY